MQRSRWYGISLSCAHCGGIFSASRADAKYCCGAHRLAAHRKNTAIQKKANQIQRMVGAWADDAAKTSDGREEMVRLVLRMQAQLSGLITRYDY